ncbi:MAG: TatD family hydrolase [Candidatus Dojkabacteria bacterium]|nr:MAG: TatD family hydrolase [Candidatus Dojkabacteria bacterium]
MTDSHTHLTSDEIYPEVDSFVNRFIEAGGSALLNVAHNIESINQSLELHRKYQGDPRFSYRTSIGLHPDNFSANSLYGKTYSTHEAIKPLLKNLEGTITQNLESISAIGETGLDYYRFPYDEGLTAEQISTTYEVQKSAFRWHLELADRFTKPLTIHTRESKGQTECITDAIKLVSEVGEGRLTGSFHSFTGEVKFVEDILNLGFYIGFNGIITYSSADDVREILKEVPLERVLLETDAPFLPPRSVRNKKNAAIRHGQPSDILEIAEKVAEVKSISIQEVLRVTTENFTKLFG